MSGLDSRIMIVGIPQIAAALKADAEQAIWFTQAYLLGTTVALLLIGRVSDVFGRVKVYTCGFTIFTIGSALTSLAQVPMQVVLFRGLQGLGAAILFTNSAAVITDAAPHGELGLFLGVNQIAFRFGAISGLTISGLILSLLDWRALFYINIPIGVFGTAWAHLRLKEIATLEKGAPIDWIGFITFTTCLTSFILSLTYAAYGIAEQTTVDLLLAASVISLTAFILYERRAKHPLLDFRLLSIREFTGGVVAQLLNSIAMGAVLLLISLYFQLVLDLSPFDAGIRIIPIDVTFLILGPISGRLSDKFGHLPFTTSGLALTSLSLYLLSTVDAFTPYLDLTAYMLLFGAGLGMFSSPNMSSIMGSVPPHRRGIASACRATFFNIGFTVSLNLAIVVMTLTVPYRIVTLLISSTNLVSIPEADRILFACGLRSTYLWLAVLNTIAIVPSIFRGRRREDTNS